MSVAPFRAEHLVGWEPARFVTPDDAARMAAVRYGVTVKDGDKILMCAGAYEAWAGRFMMWSILDYEAAKGHWLAIHKAAHDLVRQVCEVARRLEANVACDHEAGHRWVRHLGFKLECERMAKFMPNGGDAALYVIVKESGGG